MGKMERNRKRNNNACSFTINSCIYDLRGDGKMKLSDYNKIINKMKILGYPIDEMTAEDTWLMLKAFS